MLTRFIYFEPLSPEGSTRKRLCVSWLQGDGGVWFCGAYFGAGFHEDGLQAGLAVAEALGGVKRPWAVAGESDRIFLSPPPEMALGHRTA